MSKALLLIPALLMAQACPDLDDPELMYNRFFSMAYATDPNTGTNYVRELDPEEGERAWSCLERSGSLNNCKALYVLELYHRFGVGERQFGVGVDLEKAEYFKKKMKLHCEESENEEA